MPGSEDAVTTSGGPSERSKTGGEGEAQQYDEFGLPIKKPRRPVVVDEDGEGDHEVTEVTNQVERTTLEEGNRIKEPELEIVKDRVTERHSEQGNVGSEKPEGLVPSDAAQEAQQDIRSQPGSRNVSEENAHTTNRNSLIMGTGQAQPAQVASEWSHQQLVTQTPNVEEKNEKEDDGEWQEMPAYAPYDIYDDDGKLIAREADDSEEEVMQYAALGGAGKGYTRVQVDDDAESATSMDENTAYLFPERGTNLQDEDDEARDPLSQMQTTKGLLTEGQRVAYVGLVRLAMVEMTEELQKLERTRGAKKALDTATEAMKMWSQKMMIRLYGHMDISAAEQIMIEQLAEHGVVPSDMTPALMQNARVKNPAAEEPSSGSASISSPRPGSVSSFRNESLSSPRPSSMRSRPLSTINSESEDLSSPPPYRDHEGDDFPAVKTPSQLPTTKNLDIDLRWTVLCDLFLVLIADSVYDARSRQLLERVGGYLNVPWLEICRFEKRVTDALEMQEAANKENWNEEEHMKNRKKMARNKRLALMGLATVGGGLVIGLSAGLLAPVIGAGLAAGFTTIGVAGTSSFLAGAGGAAIITTTGVVTGSTIGVRASNRRTGAVKTFEYRPLHNNKRVNLIVTVAGWMNGKIDDVRLPYSTVDPIMGDIYSVFWEPEMLQSMGQTINILATEALTQGLQQVLGSTVLIALMGALQLPLALSKLSYLIDNPWTVSLARAELAGLILADSIIDRNLGVRPITLVGFSLGARVIFSCLKELARKGAYGLVQNVYMFGSPIVAKKDEYLKARSVVPGRFVNGYATNDWILGYLFRATSGGIMRVAGLAEVQVAGVENIDVTSLVKGHMAYRAAMPRLLREVGWEVESDEFTEIEDPDPDNHEQRQRELINEIEEARKNLQQKPEKKRFTWFGKKKGQKKEWETYDDRSRQDPMDGKDLESQANGVLFDIDAIRKEAAELAAQGAEAKQPDSTLPPVKSDSSKDPRAKLRETRSFNDSIDSTNTQRSSNSIPGSSRGANPFDYNEYEDMHHGEENITMTFEEPYREQSTKFNATSPGLSPIHAPDPLHSPWEQTPERPPLRSVATMPVAAAATATASAPEFNAWADEYDEEFGQEKELTMTFE